LGGSYDASAEARRYRGTEKNTGAESDLYGVANMFRYNREGTTLQRVRVF
jgi:hypothetical protein